MSVVKKARPKRKREPIQPQNWQFAYFDVKTERFLKYNDTYCWHGWEPFQVQDFGKFQRFWFKMKIGPKPK
jgi:hypothetical protein